MCSAENQKLVEVAAKANRDENVAVIQAGLADVAAKRTKPARTVLNALAKKYGIRSSEASGK